MCADHRSRVELAAITDAFSHLKIPLRFPKGLPNIEPRESIRITDPATIVRTGAEAGTAELLTMRWSWPGPKGKPVFNFRSEGREFASGRCLIVADGFYEFTDPEVTPGAKPAKRTKKDKWIFTKTGEPWFCIAGLWRESPVGDAFTMLTSAPGPDVAPYHDRQIVVIERADWGRWLDPRVPAGELIGPSPAGTLSAALVTESAANKESLVRRGILAR